MYIQELIMCGHRVTTQGIVKMTFAVPAVISLSRIGHSARGFRSRVCRLRSNFFKRMHHSLFPFLSPTLPLGPLLSLLRLHSASSELLKVHSGIPESGSRPCERRMIAITSARKVITNTFPAASRCTELQAELRTALKCIVLEERAVLARQERYIAVTSNHSRWLAEAVSSTTSFFINCSMLI